MTRSRLTAHRRRAWLGGQSHATVLSWQAPTSDHVEIRIGAPDGPLFSASGRKGRAEIGPWLRDATTFYLQDVSGGRRLSAEHTLATLLVGPREPGEADGSMAAAARAAIFWSRVALRKLQVWRLPIRIVFIAQDPLDWFSLDSVHAACVSDPAFNVHVINVGFHDVPHGYSTDCASLFRLRGIEYQDGSGSAGDLDRLRPDVVALSSPYDDFRPETYRTPALRRRAKLVYIPYCIDLADRQGAMAPNTWGTETHRSAWRIFTRSSRTVTEYQRVGHIPAHRIVCLGHPRIDQYYAPASSQPLPDPIVPASAGKFKIIYAPHHTLDGWSTFLRYATDIRRFLDEHDDCYLVFRPHPYLVGALRRSGMMAEQDFRAMFAGERCCLYEGTDYYQLFRWSNLLISDASSFLVEYAPTRHPIVYLSREDGFGGLDDSLNVDVHGSCYVAANAGDIRTFIEDIKSGSDPLRGSRERYQENMSVGMFTGGAGARIARHLRDRLS